MNNEQWPKPITGDAGETGAALRQYAERTQQAGDEAAAYSRVMDRVQARPRRLRWLVPVAAAATVVCAAMWMVRAPSRDAIRAPSITVSRPSPAPAVRTLDLDTMPRQLPAGTIELTSHVTAVVAENTVAKGRFEEGTLDIELQSGRIELRVPPREIGQAVLVTANRFRFTVVGTAFSLVLGADQVDLNVSEGLVAVSRDADHVAAVVAGEHWSTRLPPNKVDPVAAAPRIAQKPPRKECAAAKDKVACFREKARKTGADGERAQHALARYLRDDVVDLTAALSEFEAQRARFPRGELRTDADRAIIDLLPRLGRHAEALVETQSFLDAQPDAEDRAEIRLLRGDIYRAIYRDLMSAEREYDEGSEADGRAGDDSRFLRALCLEALGRVDEARVAYADYLAQSGTAHEREVKRRMEKLAR